MHQTTSEDAGKPDQTGPGAKAQLAAVKEATVRMVAKYGVEEVADAVQDPDTAPARYDLIAHAEALGIEHNGKTVYPAFQFDDDGNMDAAWVAVARRLLDADWLPQEVLLWACATNTQIGDRIPLDVMDSDPEALEWLLSREVEGVW